MATRTASTRHIADLSVTTPGDDGLTGAELAAILVEALKARGIDALAVEASDDVGLGAEDFAFCYETEVDGEAEFLYFPVAGAALRESSFDTNWEPMAELDLMRF